jgi:HTH-type transcriptional regulator/antitoxin HipB
VKEVRRVGTVNGIRSTVLAQRRALGLSQAEVALRAGVSRKWLSEFERGKVTAELGLVLRLFDALELTVAVTPERTTAPVEVSSVKRRESLEDSTYIKQIDLDELLSEYRS